jgi:dolichol-phosphate mannosyltransferase
MGSHYILFAWLIMRTSVVVPTYNERENLKGLVERILSAADVEVVVVDDASPDGTGALADQLASTYGIKVVHRSGKLGLASAMLDGLKAAGGDIVGVMDADFSHPPELIPKLIEPIAKGEADVVFASRYVKGGGVEDWPLRRKITSNGARLLARPLTGVRDCMSGFFFIRKGVIDGVRLETVGFKLGLEILVKGKYGKVVEVPFIFRDRAGGKSKLSGKEYFNYLRHLIRLYGYRLGLL